MRRQTPGGKSDALDTLLEEILVDAYGEDEQLWAFRQVIEDEAPLPIDAYVLGEPVSVRKIDYDGNERRGLTAQCRRDDGSVHIVSLADVRVGAQAQVARYVAAYRKWLGLDPVPLEIGVRIGELSLGDQFDGVLP